MTTQQQGGALRIAAAAAAMATGTLRPRRPDQRFLDSIGDAGLPPGTQTVRVRRLRQATRRVPALGIIEGAVRHEPVGLALNAFVVEHPQATFLVDPALCENASERALNELPPLLRRLVTVPPDAVPTHRALEGTHLDFALSTHAHWDHVCGLLDLGDLPLVLHDAERDWILRGEVAPAGGVRTALQRELRGYGLDGPPVATFLASHDLFGDGSVVLVDLAGHTPGSVGVLLRTEGESILIAGDAAWHYEQVELIRQKPGIPGRLVDVDRDAAFKTLHRLHLARHRVRVVPTHDAEAASHVCEGPGMVRSNDPVPH